MRSLKVYTVVLIVLLLLQGCSKPRGWWEEGVIGVMADSTDWIALKGPLKRTFERVVRTPQIEKMFELNFVNEADFFRYSKFRYLILAATFESKGRVKNIIDKVLSDPELRRDVEKGNHYVFVQRNQWAQNQMMIILISNDIPSLSSKIEANKDFLYGIFDTDFKQSLSQDMFKGRQNEDEKERLMSTFGWTFSIQQDYFLAQEIPEEGFLWYRRVYPERWIYIRWIDGGDSTLLTPYWTIGERNRIGAEYYGGDRVESRYLFSKRGRFLDRPAQITTGLWVNDAKDVGGPFKNYTFYDALSRRIYMIDLAVYAPGKDKVPYLRRLDVAAHTFRTIFDRE